MWISVLHFCQRFACTLNHLWNNIFLLQKKYILCCSSFSLSSRSLLHSSSWCTLFLHFGLNYTLSYLLLHSLHLSLPASHALQFLWHMFGIIITILTLLSSIFSLLGMNHLCNQHGFPYSIVVCWRQWVYYLIILIIILTFTQVPFHSY